MENLEEALTGHQTLACEGKNGDVAGDIQALFIWDLGKSCVKAKNIGKSKERAGGNCQVNKAQREGLMRSHGVSLKAPHPRLPVGALSHELKVWFWPQRLTMYELFSIFNRVTGAKNLGKALQPHLGVGLGMQPFHRPCLDVWWPRRSWDPVYFVPLASPSCSLNLTFYTIFTGLLYIPYHRENKCHQKWASWNFLPSIAVILWYNKKCVFWSLPLAPGQSS